MAVLERLDIAIGASFDSNSDEHEPTCLADTRVELLEEIRDWAADLSAEPIFWLNGMAGTGKSTISRTVAEPFASQGRLGASFFEREARLTGEPLPSSSRHLRPIWYIGYLPSQHASRTRLMLIP